MTEALRGVVLAGALMAAYYSLRLLVAFVRTPRHHVARHVLWMNTALLITAGVIAARLVVVWGERRPLTLWDAALAVQVACLVAGLRPVWMHHRNRRTIGEPA